MEEIILSFIFAFHDVEWYKIYTLSVTFISIYNLSFYSFFYESRVVIYVT